MTKCVEFTKEMGFEAGTDGYRGERMNKGTQLLGLIGGVLRTTQIQQFPVTFFFFFVAPDTSPQLAPLSQNRL